MSRLSDGENVRRQNTLVANPSGKISQVDTAASTLVQQGRIKDALFLLNIFMDKGADEPYLRTNFGILLGMHMGEAAKTNYDAVKDSGHRHTARKQMLGIWGRGSGGGGGSGSTSTVEPATDFFAASRKRSPNTETQGPVACFVQSLLLAQGAISWLLKRAADNGGMPSKQHASEFIKKFTINCNAIDVSDNQELNDQIDKFPNARDAYFQMDEQLYLLLHEGIDDDVEDGSEELREFIESAEAAIGHMTRLINILGNASVPLLPKKVHRRGMEP